MVGWESRNGKEYRNYSIIGDFTGTTKAPIITTTVLSKAEACSDSVLV